MLDASVAATMEAAAGQPRVERRRRLPPAALAVANQKVRKAYSPIVIAGGVRIADFILISAADQDWLNDVWLPRAIELGLRRVALVQPSYYFNRVAVDNVTSRTDPNRLTVAYFDDADNARAWLAGH